MLEACESGGEKRTDVLRLALRPEGTGELVAETIKLLARALELDVVVLGCGSRGAAVTIQAWVAEDAARVSGGSVPALDREEHAQGNSNGYDEQAEAQHPFDSEADHDCG